MTTSTTHEIKRYCECGCGQIIQPAYMTGKVDPKTRFIVGHNDNKSAWIYVDEASEPAKLMAEFGAMANKLVWQHNSWLNRNDISLEREDLYQEAMYALARRAGDFDGVTGRRERGLIAWQIMKGWIGSQIQQNRWRKGNKDDGSAYIPIIDIGDDSGGMDSLDFLGGPDAYDYNELDNTLKSLLPEREYKAVKMRELGMYWHEIGLALGFGKDNPGNPHAAGATARNQLYIELRNVGVLSGDDLRNGGDYDPEAIERSKKRREAYRKSRALKQQLTDE